MRLVPRIKIIRVRVRLALLQKQSILGEVNTDIKTIRLVEVGTGRKTIRVVGKVTTERKTIQIIGEVGSVVINNLFIVESLSRHT